MIKINEDYFLTAYSHGYKACKKAKSAESYKDKYVLIGYYTSVVDALLAIRNKMKIYCVMENEFTLEEAIAEFKKIDEEMLIYFRQLKDMIEKEKLLLNDFEIMLKDDSEDELELLDE